MLNCEYNLFITDFVHALKMYYSAAQLGKNPCATDDNTCDHLCFGTSASTHTCKCAIGYHTDPADSNKCIGEEEFILYSIQHELKGIPMNADIDPEGSGSDKRVLAPISRISLATNIDFHYKYDLLFWADGDKGAITSVRRDGTGRHVVVDQTEQFENAAGDWLSGIAIDWVADNGIFYFNNIILKKLHGLIFVLF